MHLPELFRSGVQNPGIHYRKKQEKTKHSEMGYPQLVLFINRLPLQGWAVTIIVPTISSDFLYKKMVSFNFGKMHRFLVKAIPNLNWVCYHCNIDVVMIV